jgi:hypothetical protein
MACFLPVRPWVFPGPSGFPPLAAPTASFENRGDSPLLHFDATLSVLLLRLPRPSPSHVDHDPKRIVPRVSFVALQHFRTREPFFSLPLSRQRRRNVALFLRSLTRGFGYPFDEMAWLPNPWGSFSTPNARGLRSSELFSFRVIEKPSRALLSALALSGKTIRPCPGASAGLSHLESRAPRCSRVFSSGRDRCSPELSDLSGSPSGDPWKRPSPSFPSPPALLNPQPYDKKSNEPQGFPDRRLGISPLQGAGPSGLLDLKPSPTPLKDPPAADYFFILGTPGLSRFRKLSAWLPMASRLTGGGTGTRFPGHSI